MTTARARLTLPSIIAIQTRSVCGQRPVTRLYKQSSQKASLIMIPVDQLTRRERVRLESLAQAIALTQLIPPVRDNTVVQARTPPTVDDAVSVVLGRAVRIEKFLLAADAPPRSF